MRGILFCVFLGCVSGEILTTPTTNEGDSLDEASDDEIISYLKNKGLTSDTEEDAFDVSSVTTNPYGDENTEEFEKDSVYTEYDDFVNNEQVDSKMNVSSPFNEQESRLFIYSPNDEEMTEAPESDQEEENIPHISTLRNRKWKRKYSSRKGVESSKYKKNVAAVGSPTQHRSVSITVLNSKTPLLLRRIKGKSLYQLAKGRRYKPKYKVSQVKRNWRRTCCSYGKKFGNSGTTYLSANLFDKCGEITRNLSSTNVTRQCKMIFLSCCENRALRRFYSVNKLNSTLQG